MPLTLMPHQEKALLKLRNGSILKGPVGSGKTITALTYFNDVETIERLVVITTAKKRDSGDWQAEARLLGLFPEVDSWHNIKSYEDIEGAFFIFDEQRIVGSGAWVKSFLKITKRNQWILLSATPGDTWMDYIPVFLAHSFYRSRTEFLREHVVFAPFVKYPKVERFISTGVLARHLRDILVEMPYEKHTVRHGHNTSGFLARVVSFSFDLSETDQDLAIKQAIDEIVKENVSGIFRKISPDEVPSPKMLTGGGVS